MLRAAQSRLLGLKLAQAQKLPVDIIHNSSALLAHRYMSIFTPGFATETFDTGISYRVVKQYQFVVDDYAHGEAEEEACDGDNGEAANDNKKKKKKRSKKNKEAKISPELAKDMMKKAGTSEGEAEYGSKYPFMVKSSDGKATFTRAERLDSFQLKAYFGQSLPELQGLLDRCEEAAKESEKATATTTSSAEKKVTAASVGRQQQQHQQSTMMEVEEDQNEVSNSPKHLAAAAPMSKEVASFSSTSTSTSKQRSNSTATSRKAPPEGKRSREAALEDDDSDAMEDSNVIDMIQEQQQQLQQRPKRAKALEGRENVRKTVAFLEGDIMEH